VGLHLVIEVFSILVARIVAFKQASFSTDEDLEVSHEVSREITTAKIAFEFTENGC
jgi:hypothetical protein